MKNSSTDSLGLVVSIPYRINPLATVQGPLTDHHHKRIGYFPWSTFLPENYTPHAKPKAMMIFRSSVHLLCLGITLPEQRNHSCKLENGRLVGGWTPTHLKNLLLQSDQLPKNRSINRKDEWNHHLEDYHMAPSLAGALVSRRLVFSFQLPPIAHLREYVEHPQVCTFLGWNVTPVSHVFLSISRGCSGPNAAFPKHLGKLMVQKQQGIGRKPYVPWKIYGWNLQPLPIWKGKWSAKPPGNYVPCFLFHIWVGYDCRYPP